MARWRKLGLIAGGGALPARIAKSCENQSAPFFIVRIKGDADDELSQFDGVECAIGEAGKVLRAVKDAGCDAIVLAGNVRRPDFSSLKADWRGAALLPKVAAAALRGDGAVLEVLVEMFESEGLLVVGAEEALQGLAAPEGVIATRAPNDAEMADLRKAAAIISALGRFDVGQGAIVNNGQVLAIEAAEGTDSMLKRCRALEHRKGGVLVKRPKPGQELRVDLPAIGPVTVSNAMDAGLAGIALEADQALIIDRQDVIAEAERTGLFIYGFTAVDLN